MGCPPAFRSNDDDRWPWLDAIGAAIRATALGGTVVACSALERVYRERSINAAGRPVTFAFLDGSLETLRAHRWPPRPLYAAEFARLAARDTGAARGGESTITVSIEAPIDEVVGTVLAGLRTRV